MLAPGDASTCKIANDLCDAIRGAEEQTKIMWNHLQETVEESRLNETSNLVFSYINIRARIHKAFTSHAPMHDAVAIERMIRPIFVWAVGMLTRNFWWFKESLIKAYKYLATLGINIENFDYRRANYVFTERVNLEPKGRNFTNPPLPGRQVVKNLQVSGKKTEPHAQAGMGSNGDAMPNSAQDRSEETFGIRSLNLNYASINSMTGSIEGIVSLHNPRSSLSYHKQIRR